MIKQVNPIIIIEWRQRRRRDLSAMRLAIEIKSKSQ